MTGQLNPIPGDPDIVWRDIVDDKWLVIVEAVHGSTTGAGWLYIGEASTHNVIHRKRVQVSYGALFGVDTGDLDEWKAEVLRAIDNPEYRRIEK